MYVTTVGFSVAQSVLHCLRYNSINVAHRGAWRITTGFLFFVCACVSAVAHESLRVDGGGLDVMCQ